MDREANIKDTDYIECLPRMYRKSYSLWRNRMLEKIDAVSSALETSTVEAVMQQFELSARDIALLVRLCYFTPEEVERFSLRRIESQVSV